MTDINSTSHLAAHQVRQRNSERMLRSYCAQVDLRLEKLPQDEDEQSYRLHSQLGTLQGAPMVASEVMAEVRMRR